MHAYYVYEVAKPLVCEGLVVPASIQGNISSLSPVQRLFTAEFPLQRLQRKNSSKVFAYELTSFRFKPKHPFSFCSKITYATR